MPKFSALEVDSDTRLAVHQIAAATGIKIKKLTPLLIQEGIRVFQAKYPDLSLKLKPNCRCNGTGSCCCK